MKNVKVVFDAPYEVKLTSSESDAVKLEENQVWVQTSYSLISPGTELALYTGTHTGISDINNKWTKFPFYPGYAAVGTVLDVGKAVQRLRQGDQVYTLGSHASQQIMDATSKNRPIIKLPEGINPKDAVFARLAAISMTSVVQSDIQVGDIAVIIGLGLIGNLAGQFYSLFGAKAIGIDTVQERVDLARDCGFHQAVKTPGGSLQEQIMELTDGRAPDLVVEAAGLPALVTPALSLVKKRGQVIALGSTRGDVNMDVYKWIHRKGIRYIGAHEGLQDQEGFPSRLELTEYCLRQIRRKAVSVDPLVTHSLPYTEAKQAYELLLNHKETALGVILDWTEKTSTEGDVT